MRDLEIKWSWYWGAWGLLGLYMASWDLLLFGGSPNALGFFPILLLNLFQNIGWGCLGVALVRLAERYPIEKLEWRQWPRWSLHLAASLLASTLGILLAYLVFVAFLVVLRGSATPPAVAHWRWEHFLKGLTHFYQQYFHTNLVFMWAVVGYMHGLRIYRRLREREVEAAQMEARFATAQNQALRMQLQPHFLFNTLNSISALVHSDADNADRMIGRLGDFLRMTLEAPQDQMVSLRKEMAFIDAYLAIERVRFQERLKVVVDIPKALLAEPVPIFILQPLVENALKHGLADQPEGGTLTVRAKREGGHLILEVQDDGAGCSPCREGTGMSNVRARLGLLYKGKAKVELLSSPGKGTLVVLCLPSGTVAPIEAASHEAPSPDH